MEKYSIVVGAIHHITLTVTNLERSADFYQRVLGFERIADLGSRIIMHNGTFMLVVGLAPDRDEASENDRFSENRVGLDHVSFLVESKEALLQAGETLDRMHVPRGAVRDLGKGFGIYVMAFRDPDNIQLEMTAYYD